MMDSPKTSSPPRNHLVWIGLVLSLFGLLSYFIFFVRFPTLRDVPWVNLPMVMVGAALSIWAVAKRRSLLSIAGGLLSVAAGALLFWYVFAYSSGLPDSGRAVALGAAAPALELADQRNQTVRLSDFSNRDVLVVFYRGFW